MSTLTRKGFFKLAGSGAAATTLAGTAFVATRDREGGKKLLARRPDMNVVLVILDSLRKDHVGPTGMAGSKLQTSMHSQRIACVLRKPTRNKQKTSRPANPG